MSQFLCSNSLKNFIKENPNWKQLTLKNKGIDTLKKIKKDQIKIIIIRERFLFFITKWKMNENDFR